MHCVLIRHGGKRRARRAQDGKTGGKDEKLLKDQPLPCPLQRFPVGRHVDGGIGFGDAAEGILLPDILRQQLRQELCGMLQRLLHTGAQLPVGDASRERVDGQQPVRDGAGAVRRFVGGICHLHAVLRLERAVEIIALAVVQLLLDVRLVKKRDRQPARLVRDCQPRQIAALADAAQDRLRDDHGPEAGRDAGLKPGDLDGVRPVLILAREIGQKVIARDDAELRELRRPRRAESRAAASREKTDPYMHAPFKNDFRYAI